MKLILDTHILLWWLQDSRQITKHCDTLIRDNPDEVLVSIASVWEIAIKVSVKKLAVTVENFQSQIVDNGFQLLPVTVQHAVEYARLPLHHRDPFDRMLIAQSLTESARLLTHDAGLNSYGAFVLVV